MWHLRIPATICLMSHYGSNKAVPVKFQHILNSPKIVRLCKMEFFTATFFVNVILNSLEVENRRPHRSEICAEVESKAVADYHFRLGIAMDRACKLKII